MKRLYVGVAVISSNEETRKNKELIVHMSLCGEGLPTVKILLNDDGLFWIFS